MSKQRWVTYKKELYTMGDWIEAHSEILALLGRFNLNEDILNGYPMTKFSFLFSPSTATEVWNPESIRDVIEKRTSVDSNPNVIKFKIDLEAIPVTV